MRRKATSICQAIIELMFKKAGPEIFRSRISGLLGKTEKGNHFVLPPNIAPKFDSGSVHLWGVAMDFSRTPHQRRGLHESCDSWGWQSAQSKKHGRKHAK